MIDFYYWPTPNGWKISIMLEECGLDYEVHPVHIGRGDQFKPEFLAISPNNRIPALVDHAGNSNIAGDGEPLKMFESGTILVYLAEKTGRLMPTDPHGRFDVLQWLFWQMGGLLAGRDFICGEYSIADIACWPWIRAHERLGQPLDEFAHLQRWFETIAARPAVERGVSIGAGLWTAGDIDDEARKKLFNQTAASVGEQADEAKQRND